MQTKSVSRPPQFEQPETQVHQRHVTAAGIDQRLQVRVPLMAAGFAPDEDADIVRLQRGPRCRQHVEIVAHRVCPVRVTKALERLRSAAIVSIFRRV
jgi:hypothetical protein